MIRVRSWPLRAGGGPIQLGEREIGSDAIAAALGAGIRIDLGDLVDLRAEFEWLSAVRPDTLTDLERAARFLYLQRTAFGGKVAGQSFGVTYGGGRFDITRLVPLLEAVHERLAGVVIECLPWAEFLDRYDQAEALFYLDPPYWGSEEDYGIGVWRRSDFGRLAGRLRTLKGRFLLSINDLPEVRRCFEGFHFEEVETVYTIASKADAVPTVPELLISDRPIDVVQPSLMGV